MKKTIIASLVLAASCSAQAASTYFVVVPVPGRAPALLEKINVRLGGVALPGAVIGTPYEGFDFKRLLTVTGDPGYSGVGVRWSVSDGKLPAGLTLRADGTLTGTPTERGAAGFKVKATYMTKAGEQAYEVFVADIKVSLAAAIPPGARAGTPYAYNLVEQLTVSGDPAFDATLVRWSVVASTLPSGLQLTAAGVISGTPTAAGTGTVTARATYRGVNGEQTYEIVSVAIEVTLAEASLPEARVGLAYSAFDFKNKVTVTGDSSFDATKIVFTSTGMPEGMTLSPVGVLTGTPTKKAGQGKSFQVVASYKSQTGEQEYTIVVNGMPLAVSQIAAGAISTCALTTGGGVKCWGSNGSGQLGNGTKANSLDPVDVVGLTSGVTSITAGWQHVCARTTAGAAKCWGTNSGGRLGDGTGTDSSIPVQVSGLTSGVTSIAAGHYHNCAVVNGAAKCWGSNGNGNIGNNTTTDALVPATVSGLSSGVASIAAGGAHTCARTTAGAVKCWGYNSNGVLGTGSQSPINSYVPLSVSGLTSGVTSITAGYMHTCALVSNQVKCWGYNEYGQLGNGTLTHNGLPQTVLSGVTEVVAGHSHTCARTTANTVQCWGFNQYGQLGNGSTTNRSLPTNVTGLATSAISLSLGHWHSCAVLGNGAAQCWGVNSSGQLGSHGTTGQLTPATVEAP